MSKRTFQAVKGMQDILPNEQAYWEKVRQVIKSLAEVYGFGRIDTPIVEETDLFIKGTGASTDIVEKEMYNLKTKGGDRLTLRPEFTPGIVRSYLENGMLTWSQPVWLYSLGPVFRYGRPQKGRYRQFHQANFEIIGSQDAALDAQLIQVFFSIARELGLKDLITQINSIGCNECRPAYRKKLINYYKPLKKEICPSCQKRLAQNPLRLLDCKENKCVRLSEHAPQIIDYLCNECRCHFRSVLEFLDELNIPYIINHHLVRGLDYYTKTVFEVWPEEKEETRQDSLGGGGRYDNLVKILGGRDTPAVGFAMGLERMINLMKEKGIRPSLKFRPSVFIVQLGDLAKKKSLKLFEDLRQAGLRVAASFSHDTIKSQLKAADKNGALFALILGQKEVIDQTIIIRDMSSGAQETVPMSKVINELKKRTRKK